MNYNTKWKKELNDLLNKWDPIGVYPFEGRPKDEYECFVEPILKLLYHGEDEKSIMAFLRKHLREHIGLEPKNVHPEKFSEDVLRWWNIKKK